MDSNYNKYDIIQLEETDIKQLSDYIKQNSYLWDKVCGHYHCLTLAIKYQDIKICCTQRALNYSTVVIYPDRIINTECFYKNYKEFGICTSTGDERLDKIIEEVSFFFPLYSEYCFSWLIEDFFKIYEQEYSDAYEKARSEIINYENQMVKKYLW